MPGVGVHWQVGSKVLKKRKRFFSLWALAHASPPFEAPLCCCAHRLLRLPEPSAPRLQLSFRLPRSRAFTSALRPTGTCAPPPQPSAAPMWMANNAVPVAPRSGALPPLSLVGWLCTGLLLSFFVSVLMTALALAFAGWLVLCVSVAGHTAGPLLFNMGLVGLLAYAARLFFFFNSLPAPPGLTPWEVQESREQQVLELLQDWRATWR